MGRTIAQKKLSVGLLYIALTVFGCIFAVDSFIGMNILVGIISSVVTIVCAVLSVKFLSLPLDIVVLTDEHTIALPKGVRIPLTSIVDVSYSEAGAASKGIKYKWGKITISTVSDSFKYDFVCECKEAAKQLMSLVETEKKKSE